MPPRLRARIRFLMPPAPSDWRPRSGVRPHLRIGEVFTSCVVRRDEVDTFEFERDYDVTLELVFWKEYGSLLNPGMSVELYTGSQLIASGRLTEDTLPRD